MIKIKGEKKSTLPSQICHLNPSQIYLVKATIKIKNG